ncbi:MAG: hypothetical protein R3F39_16965 [Myxococcota bacterium]
MIRTLGLAAAAFCLVMFSSCDLAESLGGLVPDKDNYDFSTSCKGNSSLEACSPCCDGLGFDTALVVTGDCGCAYVATDGDVCDSANGSDFKACVSCCETNKFDSLTRLTNGQCTCSRVQKTEPEATSTPNDGNHDGCTTSGQSCVCSNSGLSGSCDTGSAKSGLYCHCD